MHGVIVAQRSVRTDENAERLLGEGLCQPALGGEDACGHQRLLDGVAGCGARDRALDTDRKALAARAVQERLRIGPDNGGHAHRRAPVVLVPPDDVVTVELHGTGTLLGLHSVDVEEPVDRAPATATTGDTVDRLHEPAAEARRDLCVALQQPHHRVRALRLSGRLSATGCGPRSPA